MTSQGATVAKDRQAGVDLIDLSASAGATAKPFCPIPGFRAASESAAYARRARRDAVSKLESLSIARKRPSMPANVRAADYLQPPTAEMALYGVVGEVVGDLAKAPKEAGSIGEAAHR